MCFFCVLGCAVLRRTGLSSLRANKISPPILGDLGKGPTVRKKTCNLLCLMTSTLMRQGGPIGDEREGPNQFFGGILGYGPAEVAGYREVSRGSRQVSTVRKIGAVVRTDKP